MTQNVTPIRPFRKVAKSAGLDPARTLRECCAGHGLVAADLAAIWDVCETQARRLLNGERPLNWARLGALPPAVLADWCRQLGARLDSVVPVRSVEVEHLDIVVELGRLTDELRSAMADGRLDDEERLRIRRAAARLASEVADLQRAVG